MKIKKQKVQKRLLQKTLRDYKNVKENLELKIKQTI